MYDGDERVPYIMSEKWYNILKWATMIVLPALGTLYSTLGELWGWPYLGEVSNTVLAICTAIGTILGYQSFQKFKQTANSTKGD